jgi:hypothetical protein
MTHTAFEFFAGSNATENIFLLQFAIVDFQNDFELAKCFQRFSPLAQRARFIFRLAQIHWEARTKRSAAGNVNKSHVLESAEEKTRYWAQKIAKRRLKITQSSKRERKYFELRTFSVSFELFKQTFVNLGSLLDPLTNFNSNSFTSCKQSAPFPYSAIFLHPRTWVELLFCRPPNEIKHLMKQEAYDCRICCVSRKNVRTAKNHSIIILISFYSSPFNPRLRLFCVKSWRNKIIRWFNNWEGRETEFLRIWEIEKCGKSCCGRVLIEM